MNGANNIVTNTIQACPHPSGVAVEEPMNRVYVTCGDNTLTVIDGSTQMVIARIPVWLSPAGVAVNPNNHTVFVTNFNGSSVSVIDGTRNVVITTVPVGQTPFGVHVDATRNLAYAANQTDGSISIIGSP